MSNQTGNNPYLWNRQGETPFDSMDSLDRLELELLEDELNQQEPSGCSPQSNHCRYD
jgi:hypothetical protein